MIAPEELKVGLFVWWSAGRHFSSWSCPCVVSDVGDKSFRVKSLDNFMETEDLSKVRTVEDPGVLHEMRICTLEEVRQYFMGQLREKEDEVIKAQRTLEDRKRGKDVYEAKIKVFLGDRIAVAS